jgi:Mg2+-importing ATPase
MGAHSAPGPALPHEAALAELGSLSAEACCARLDSDAKGLPADEARRRLAADGPNIVARSLQPSVFEELLGRAKNPLNALLLTLALVSLLLGDRRAAIVIIVMVLLAVLTSFIQEHRSNEAAAKLRALVRNTASVRRSDVAGGEFHECAIEDLVRGDIVHLSAGDMLPADLRLLEAKDLFINQATLTGEALPVEKFAHPATDVPASPFDIPNLCFMGANVVSGYAIGVVVRTGRRTFFGQIADSVSANAPETDFDRGIARFTWLMLKFMMVMVPVVFLVNGLSKHDWLEALFFALAVAVGLTPEMLPMIVTVNLAKGAIAMSRAKVIVKRLDAIQNLGAMDVLCSDKTGTLTQDRIILKRHLDIFGNETKRVLQFSYLNSHFQSGLKNLLDVAVLRHVELHKELDIDAGYTKVDEVPFDFARRRMSVVVENREGKHLLICKGAVEEVVAVSTHYEAKGERGLLDESHFASARAQTEALNADGFRVVAVAYRELPASQKAYSVADETDLVLLGYIAFLDPPKETAAEALSALARRGVTVKILTGDNAIVTAKICRDVGLEPGAILLGQEIDKLSAQELKTAAEGTRVFAKLTPAQKERVIGALRKRHVVGFLGDGINDSPALKAADVGISVDTAVDIAKESADIILLEKSLLVLQEGVVEGRKIFSNILKYIRMGASSNFGNMLSVLGASIFLPFLPMSPIQVLTNNLLYDFSQTAIPTDAVDDEQTAQPRRWDIDNIFKFMIVLGPVSSLFDYATFAGLIWFFGGWTNPALFQTGWFVESLLTQTLVIHVIRTQKIPFFESRASATLTATTVVICLIGAILPYTLIGSALGFAPLPLGYWPMVLAFAVAYGVLAHLVKVWFVRRWGM